MGMKELIKLGRKYEDESLCTEFIGFHAERYIRETPSFSSIIYREKSFPVAYMFRDNDTMKNYIAMIRSGYAIYVFCVSKESHETLFIGSYQFKDIEDFSHIFTISNKLLYEQNIDARRYSIHYVSTTHDELTMSLYDLPYRMDRKDRGVRPLFPKQVQIFQEYLEGKQIAA